MNETIHDKMLYELYVLFQSAEEPQEQTGHTHVTVYCISLSYHTEKRPTDATRLSAGFSPLFRFLLRHTSRSITGLIYSDVISTLLLGGESPEAVQHCQFGVFFFFSTLSHTPTRRIGRQSARSMRRGENRLTRNPMEVMSLFKMTPSRVPMWVML